MIHERGASHSVYVQWDRDGEFVGWYANLEEPWRDTTLGFDTTDHLLDVWVDPDRSWRLKDEDHLAEAVEIGLLSQGKARAIRAEAERAIERVDAWRSPFDESWEHWQPDPGWPLPHVPDGWQDLDGVRPRQE
jgi:predicted RNA-binding protein associated with RNAse of E/G family